MKDWCKQNGISRDSYYYWHIKLIDIKKEQDNPFVEVLPTPAPLILVGKVTELRITIAWKDFSISVTDQQSIPMVAELISRLENYVRPSDHGCRAYLSCPWADRFSEANQ